MEPRIFSIDIQVEYTIANQCTRPQPGQGQILTVNQAKKLPVATWGGLTHHLIKLTVKRESFRPLISKIILL